ncbi:hypothetical protein amyaer_1800 [Microcystis aeruginosa NIES-2481]|nr:hypothetical protein [Microcystis aeruginosa]AOC52525.1 hypothetical protein amyaer_1800 [Microcystis aeruginosa NIES-2481]
MPTDGQETILALAEAEASRLVTAAAEAIVAPVLPVLWLKRLC